MTQPNPPAYVQILKRERKRALINSMSGLLGWDERTYLPGKGIPLRSDQLALLACMSHDLLCDPKLLELLAQAEIELKLADADDPRRANLKGIRRQVQRAQKLPAELVEAMARATTVGQQAWEAAKKANCYADFAPALQKILQLKREEAQAVGIGQHPYDSLLDEYEPGMTVQELEVIFKSLKTELVAFIGNVVAAKKKHKPSASASRILERAFPVDRQKILCQTVAASIGFDFNAGRLDETAHPFCSGQGPGDVRLTTRYNERYFNEAFFGTLHEAGHGLYEQNLPSEHYGTPLGQACSLGMHESQSRLWENQVGRSMPFWDYYYPIVQAIFPESLGDVAKPTFFAAINDVQPSLIRIEADEVTYNLHILLRFELELALITGELSVQDLPAAWNEKFKAYFQITPENDALGCLQDIHWSAGLFGYFPTYTLGNLYAAQFMVKAKGDLADLNQRLSQGHFRLLTDWLQHNIHAHGQRYSAKELGLKVTGSPLSQHAFMHYLREKYETLYA